MRPDFYQKFESVFRGSRGLIKQRLNIYEDFLTPFSNLRDGNINALDLGCGRGEWLEFLDEKGIKSIGIDFDAEMLEDCKKYNLKVFNFNAIEYLKNTASESFQIISAFHFVEHISLEDLKIVIKESLRVLKPGGLLILETPNCENISVATNSFYLDPTHVRPLPPDLMLFMAQYFGYIRSKVIGVNQLNPRLNGGVQSPLLISDLLCSVCPDYALIAQKEGPNDVLNKFNDAFDKTYGILKLKDLLGLYEMQVSAQFEENEILRGQVSTLQKSLMQIQDSFPFRIFLKISRLFRR